MTDPAALRPIGSLILVGRDAPLWLAACVMQSALGCSGLRVTVVELPADMDAADGFASLPALELPAHAAAHRRKAACWPRRAVPFTLGKHFHDTTGRAASFFHAYGSTGARINDLEFLPQWIRARRFGMPVAYEDFCLTAVAARHGRMLVPDGDIERNGFTDCGVPLLRPSLCGLAEATALRRGVAVHDARKCSWNCRASRVTSGAPAARWRASRRR